MTRTILLYLITACCIFSGNHINAQTFLVFGGKKGWIGGQMITLLREQGHTAIAAQSRLENRTDVENEIVCTQPDCIINCAGVTGRPNVDWCESNKQATIQANLIGALTLFDIACNKNIHVINFGTGCIYEYDEAHPMLSGIGFKEEEKPNFQGSFYSYTKTILDQLIEHYPNVLNLRLRMPISDDLHHRSFITKITNYERVVNIPNSMSVLHDLLPLVPEMAARKLTGNYNFVNPGVISHNEILELYKEYIDPTFRYINFSVEEQAKVIKAGRSNNELDTQKLEAQFPQVTPIKQAMVGVFKRMKQNLNT